MTLEQAIGAAIEQQTGRPFQVAGFATLGGGCINRAGRIDDGRHSYFVKSNRAALLPMFEAEAAGLREILASDTLRAPRPVAWGATGSDAFLVLEYIDLRGHGDAAECGRRLARMHRAGAASFGWSRDNTIGATPQPNGWMDDWCAFWRERRLGFQLRLAARNGHHGALQRRGERLLELFPALLDHRPQPSLLHGDLWGGNIGYDAAGRPVIFDPAVYYGDREADLAMTELFGGPGAAFHAAYREAWPLDPGYPVRKTLYNLYHVINHLNLFGGGYGGQALAMIDQLLAELGH